MKTAAAAKTGGHRAEIHNSTGNSSATGTSIVQGSGGSAMTTTLITISDARATRPSTVSPCAGGSRVAEANPIISGAIVMMPSASDANHSCQMASVDVVAPWNKTHPRVPPTPDTEVATLAA